MAIEKLHEARNKLIADARSYWDGIEATVKKEDRSPTEDENQRFDKMLADADGLKAEIAEVRAAEDRAAKLAEVEKTLEQSAGRKTTADDPNTRTTKTDQETTSVEIGAGRNKRTIRLEGPLASNEYRDNFNRFLMDGEKRALKAGADDAGGYTVAPMMFQTSLIQAVDNLVFMRQICNVLPPVSSSNGLGAPSLDADPADPTWTAELSIGTEDSTMDFGKRELHPHPLAQFIKVSRTLLRSSAMNVDALVRERLAYKASVVLEYAYMQGDGAKQPLGIFEASSDGIPTGRDVSTGNTATDLRFDGLIEATYKLKGPHRSRASWIFGRNGVKRIRKLKDGNGQYIWQASILADQPDTILARPVYESEYVPDTWESGNYVGMIGDFSNYWIVDSLTLSIQVLLELYAGANQNGYLARLESDGMPVLAEAFARVKLA